jgi:HEAT repeat protein
MMTLRRINSLQPLIMKIIFFILLLFFLSITGICQDAKRDSIRNALSQYTQTVNRAAETFLNRQNPAEVRLKAIAPYPLVYDEQHVQQFKNVVLSNDETPDIRAMALNKIYQHVNNDDELFEQVLRWFQNPETPKALRDETLNLVGNLSFSSFAGVVEPYKKMIRDPDPRFRTFALSKLVLNGDPEAQQLLIRGLEDQQSQLLEPPLAIEILALSPKKEFYPVAYKILQETRDEPTRLAALETLGPYREARQKIVSISRDSTEKDEFRIAALMALYSGDKENIVTYVAPILQDRSASARLQSLGIQMATDVRKAMAYRRSKKARKADEFDNQVKNIAEGRGVLGSREVRQIANNYLLLVRPAF